MTKYYKSVVYVGGDSVKSDQTYIVLGSDTSTTVKLKHVRMFDSNMFDSNMFDSNMFECNFFPIVDVNQF